MPDLHEITQHLALGASESHEATFVSDWERWCARVEKLIGHDIDGDNSERAKAAGTADGYSLDEAYDAWREGQTANDYALELQALAAERVI